MTTRHDLASNRPALSLCLLLSLVLVGCDVPLNNDEASGSVMETDGAGNLTMGPPAEWLTFRAVNLDALDLRFTLDGDVLPTTRSSNNQWTVSFTLPDNDIHTLQATWLEQLTGRTMTLAVSDEIPIGNALPERRITISEYNHQAFDEDGDGISNLDERRLDLDPFVNNPVTLGPNQSDCQANTATLTFSAFFVTGVSPAFANPLTLASSVTSPIRDSAETPGRLALFESFFVLTPGVITVSHASGPTTTGSILYDTDTNGMLRLLDEDNVRRIPGTETFEERRAVVTANVQPGLYCYRLESTRVNTAVIDPGLQLTFVADREQSTATPQEALDTSNEATAALRSTQRGAVSDDVMMSAKQQ